MTVMFGVFHADMRPVDEHELEPVRQFFAAFPSCETHVWRRGSVGLGAGTNPGLANHCDSWPAISIRPESELAITAAARLDNREELAAKLGLSQHLLSALSDDALILKAYEKWGRDCPAQLLGDFAFAIWDGPHRQLFCARDHMGIMPFYYAFHNNSFVFASDIQGVLACPGVPGHLSDLGVARYMMDGDLFDGRLTFYEAVSKLPPATTLTVGEAGIAETRYWHAENAPPVRYGEPGDYTDRLRELLELSVKARLPAEGPVGAHLSGGLDSSGLAAISAKLLGDQKSQLKTWSWMQAPASREEAELPEWSMGLSVANYLGLDHRFTDFNADALLGRFDDKLLQRNDTMDMWYEFDVREQARRAGIRVMLSGWGGDQLITHYGHQRYAETLRPGSFAATLGALLDEARRAANPPRRFIGLCYRHLLQLGLPKIFGRGGRSPHLESMHLRCMNDDFASWVRELPSRPADNGRTVRAHQLRYINQYFIQTRLDSWAASGTRAGISYRYPLLDKRIVEFALGIPPDLYRTRGYSRYIFRSAISQGLPEEAAWKSVKMEPHRIQALFDITTSACQQWIRSANQAGNPYISLAKLASEIARLKTDSDGVPAEEVFRLMTITRAILVLGL